MKTTMSGPVRVATEVKAANTMDADEIQSGLIALLDSWDALEDDFPAIADEAAAPEEIF